MTVCCAAAALCAAWPALGLTLLLAVTAASCRQGAKSERTASSASASPGAAVSRVRETGAPPTRVPEAPHAMVPRLESGRCRVLRVSGDVKLASGAALAAMSPIDGDTWIEFARNAEIVVRHSVSARELLLRGPGLMLPCRGGAEQVLIESGTLKSAPGTGVRPGAVVWIGTPFGSAHYGDGAVEVTVAKARWTIVVQSGTVWTDPSASSPAGGDPPARQAWRLNGGERASFTGTSRPEALLLACQTLATEAKTAAERVASGGPGLGERAAAQLVLRQRARSACLSAAAGARRVANAEQRARLEDQVRAADQVWEHVPAPNKPSGAGGAP